MKKTKRLKIRSERVRLILKWLIYAFLAAAAYIYLTTFPGSFAKPLLLVPLALCISMRETELPSALTGAVCGLMLDSACGKVFGYNAFLLMILCMFTSLLFLYLMRQNWINSLMVNAAAALLLGILDFFFYYGIWSHANVELLLVRNVLPAAVLTVLASAAVYVVIKIIDKRFGVQEQHYIEEKSENIVRE